MTTTTLIHHLERNATSRGGEVALRDRLSGVWRDQTWAEYNTATRRVGKALMALGVEHGAVVSILAPNRPEWLTGALGAMRVGGISAGIYTTCSPEEVAYVLSHGEAVVAIAENDEQLAKVLETWDGLPALRTVVLMDGDGPADDDRVLGWAEFLQKGDGVSDEDLDARLAAISGDDIADFIYTSGTTGPPKAVMLSHDNLAWTANAIGSSVGVNSSDHALSYLPLSHIAEQMSSMLMAVTFGYTVSFCHDGLQLPEFIKEVRPTSFFGVPRVWERFEAGIKTQLGAATGAKAKIAAAAMQVGAEHSAVLNRGETPSKLLAAKYGVADKLFFSKVKSAMGLDRTRFFVSGAAPIAPSILEFLSSVDMSILELYGMSEDTGITTTNLPGANRFGTVGKAVDGLEVKIAEDGEILVRGKSVFAGYYKNQEATDETIVDGWLHSGDLGKLEDGYLSIIGRKKDIIITSGGKNISPQNIEEELGTIDVVGTAVVVGEQQRFLVALLTLEPEAAGRFAKEHGISVEGLHDDPSLRAHLEERIAADVNPLMARVEHIRNFVVLPNEFTTEGGELTPTLKVKRNVVNDKYANEIAAAYEAGQAL